MVTKKRMMMFMITMMAVKVMTIIGELSRLLTLLLTRLVVRSIDICWLVRADQSAGTQKQQPKPSKGLVS